MIKYIISLSLLLLMLIHTCSSLQIGALNGLKIQLEVPSQLLRSNIELISSRDDMSAEIDDSLSNAVNQLLDDMEVKKDRPQIEACVKNIQRLQLQLDRSDGRSDITSDIIADKYFEFCSTCLRTDGGAWVAPLGPLQYVGFFMSKQIDSTTNPSTRIISLKGILTSMAQVLIDLPLNQESPNLEKGEANAKIIDLGLSLVRIAIRFAIFQETLEGKPPIFDKNSIPEEGTDNFPFDIKIDCDLNNGIPKAGQIPLNDLDLTLQLDLLKSPSSLILNNNIIIPKKAISQFYKSKYLE